MPLLLLEAEGGVLAASAAGVAASAAADSAHADLVCGLPLPLPFLLPGGVLPLLELWLRLLMEAEEPHGSTAQHSTARHRPRWVRSVRQCLCGDTLHNGMAVFQSLHHELFLSSGQSTALLLLPIELLLGVLRCPCLMI